MNNIGIGHNNPPPHDRITHRVASQAPNIPTLAASAKQHFQAAAAATRKKWEETRAGLQDLFIIFCAIMADPAEQESLKAVCFREHIPMTSFDVTRAVVRYYGRITDNEKVNRYANVLREARLRKMPPPTLAKYLATPGCGIEKLHKAFQERRAKKGAIVKRAPSDASQDRKQDAQKREHREPTPGATMTKARRANVSAPANRADGTSADKMDETESARITLHLSRQRAKKLYSLAITGIRLCSIKRTGTKSFELVKLLRKPSTRVKSRQQEKTV